MPPFPLRFLDWLDHLHPVVVCSASVFLIVGIGFLSTATGSQLSSSLLYLIPVLVVTRVAGFRAGGLAALLSAVIWLIVDLKGEVAFDHPFIPYWNALMRLGTFLVAVSLVAGMRTVNSHLEKRVRERTSTLEAQMTEKRELERRILEISDRERAAVGQDLHDGLCQQLVSAAFSATMLQEQLTARSGLELTNAIRISDMIDDAITQARSLARGLYPVRLETEGLEMALRELAFSMSRRFDIECRMECTAPPGPIAPTTDIHLYRIAQEAVVNASKHAQPKQIVISLDSTETRTVLEIADDGIGISREQSVDGGMGLRIMEYRARMIGADFRIQDRSGGGTSVICGFDIPTLNPTENE